MREYFESLKTEITFWQQLLYDSSFASDSPEYQRIVHAIGLAELELANHEITLH